MSVYFYLKSLAINPRKLFLIDGLGAMISAFLLGYILVRFEAYFGIPKSTLYFLAILPILFAIYDFGYYILGHAYKATLLRGIAIVNVLYCLISMGLLLYHIDQIQYLAWAYILIEIIFVMILAYIEFKVAYLMTLDRDPYISKH